MSIKFKTMPRKNLKDQNAPARYYAIAAPAGKCDIDKLSRIIAKSSTVSRTDVYAVIMGVLEAINDELADGNTVYLGKIGSLGVTLSSEGAETADAVSGASIKRSRIIFRPGKELKNMLKTMSYEKVE